MTQLTEHKTTMMKAKTGVGIALATATGALLGLAPTMSEAKGKVGEWDIDTAVLVYSESDSRVQAAEPVVNLTRNYDNDAKLNIKVVADTLTGASPNGATPSDEIQTFTRPSGSGNFTVAAKDQPLDDTFQDTRGAATVTWSAPINRDWAYTAGTYGSIEYDYSSFGLNGSISRYLNNKNTTLNFGLSGSMDTITPEGGLPTGLGRMPVPGNGKSDAAFDAEYASSRSGSDDSKTVVDVLFGVTQVINRQTIMQFNYGLSSVSGYMTDPFKVLSVIDDAQGANYGGNLKGADGNSIYLYEQRPDTRTKHALYWQTKYMLDNGDVVDGSYRFATDDWGITSHTFDVRYRWALGQQYLEPHVRYYMQSEADFYKRYLTATEYNGGSPIVKEASADYRLGELTGITLGLKWGYQLNEDQEISVRAEYMTQSNSGDQGFGKLANQELYPDTNAFWVQVGYSF
ncbi:MAG: DUF3570 domain-containing protein [Hahellaceae bacterium]|nr:DUF3570 domain-containing protein [Hahellaceae bacterium]